MTTRTYIVTGARESVEVDAETKTQAADLAAAELGFYDRREHWEQVGEPLEVAVSPENLSAGDSLIDYEIDATVKRHTDIMGGGIFTNNGAIYTYEGLRERLK